MTNKRRMEKTIYSREYSVLLKLLREKRETAGLSQVELAKRLGQTQSFVSKGERGERRLDIIQIRTILREFKVSLVDFVVQLEASLGRRS